MTIYDLLFLDYMRFNKCQHISEKPLRDVLNSTYNILPLLGLATLTVFEEPVSGKLEQFISNTSLSQIFNS